MQIEVVPFFHKMTYVIMARMGPAEPNAIIATVVVSYALSSVITGLIFGALGLFKLGNLVSFFPRNILNGCIGGVGFFLFVTGIEVSARLDGNLEYNFDTLQKLFRADTVALWTSPLALAIIYMAIKHYYDHPALMPAFIVLITGIFHIIVAAVSHFNLDKARDAGWVFEKPESGVPFYHFYTLYGQRFRAVGQSAQANLMQTSPSSIGPPYSGPSPPCSLCPSSESSMCRLMFRHSPCPRKKTTWTLIESLLLMVCPTACRVLWEVFR